MRLLVLLALLAAFAAHAQQLNYGFAQPQDPATLPRSSAPAESPRPRLHSQPRTNTLAVAPDGAYRLAAGWDLAAANQVSAAGAALSRAGYAGGRPWRPATVPGTALTTLIDQGVYPDPYYGLNNMAIPDSLSRQAWWYRLRFRVPVKRRGQRARLLFGGINYQAEVWLNGHRLGAIKGAFRRGEFEVTPWLKVTGENALAVRVAPPPHPGTPHEESACSGQGPNGGALAADGPTFISSEGWDWMPGIRDRNTGIWQPVELRFGGAVTLGDPQIITNLPLPDTSRATVTVRAPLRNASARPQTVRVTGQLAGNSFSQLVTVPARGEKLVVFKPSRFAALQLRRPRLWWPNGYGRPSLYTTKLRVMTAGGQLSDQQSVRFGVRELSYEMTVDAPAQAGQRVEFNPLRVPAGQVLFDNTRRRQVAPELWVASLRVGASQAAFRPVADTGAAPYLVLRVNGRRIFCRGGNWGMDDARKRVSRARLEPYFKLHQAAHFNMIRNWTGESTEPEFYDLADEYGLLVWNDFWLSTEGYNLEPTDPDLFMANATDVVRRYRNHPSIALWCPRNEGYAPSSLENRLAHLIAAEDPTRYYQPNSRYLNLRPSGPWHYFHDPTDYYRHQAQGFTTEIGTFSVPAAATLRQFLPTADQWPISDAWYYHDFHAEHEQPAYRADLARLYGEPAGLADFARRAQLLNYEQHRAIFEAWNSRLWHNASGVLLWMTHPAWPSMIWQVYSWNYATAGAYFGVQKACEPLHVQLNPLDSTVAVVNTMLRPQSGLRVRYTLYDPAGRPLLAGTRPAAAPANQLAVAFRLPLPAQLPPAYLVRLALLSPAGTVLSQNEYWQRRTPEATFQVFNQLPAANLRSQLVHHDPDTHTLTYELTNAGSGLAVAVAPSLRDAAGRPVLPAYFADGYFTLLPHERRRLRVQYAAGVVFKEWQLVADAYNSSS